MNKELMESQVPGVRTLTDAEIRSNAEEYANKYSLFLSPHNTNYYSVLPELTRLKYAYEAGAHSRDPEIKALKARLDPEDEMFSFEDLIQEIEDLKAKLDKVKKEKDLLSSAFKIIQNELDRLKWNDANEILPPREVDGGSYSILVVTSCDDSKENHYLDRYDYQTKRWMYNSKDKVLKWKFKE